MQNNTSWEPIFNKNEAHEFKEEAYKIANYLSNSFYTEYDTFPASLAQGSAGLALFFSQIHGLDQSREWEQHTVNALEHAIKSCEKGVHSPSLYEGFSGIAWAKEWLCQTFFDPEDSQDESIDQILVKHVRWPNTPHDFDLIRGLAGYGVYALERRDHLMGAQLFDELLQMLEHIGQATPQGFTWHRAPQLLPDWQRNLFPTGQYNLGMAHGVAGIIAFLASARCRGFEHPKLLPMLEGAVSWLLANGRPFPGESFGTALQQDSGPCQSSYGRISWCYGDLGVALALLLASRACHRQDWEEEILGLCSSLAKRSAKVKNVADTCLCHGYAGNGHFLNRLYQATGLPEVGEAARLWFQRALDYCHRAEYGGATHFAPKGPDDPRPYEPSFGILEGAAGVGLAFLAAVLPKEPTWDRMFLASAPAGGPMPLNTKSILKQ